MKAFLITCLLVFLTQNNFAQGDVIEISQVKIEADIFIGVDSFGAIYYIKNNVFFKEQGTQKWQYSNFLLGQLTQVNIVNPLKVLLFYELANTAIQIDKFLNEMQRIAFNELPELKLITQTATANDRNLWLFDSNTLQLEVFNYKTSKTLFKSQPLEQLPVAMHGDFNHCWVFTKKKGYEFNSYGSILSTIENKDYSAVQLTSNGILLQKTNDLYHFNLENKLIKINLPEITLKQFYGINEILYIYDGKTLYNYQINIPKN